MRIFVVLVSFFLSLPALGDGHKPTNNPSKKQIVKVSIEMTSVSNVVRIIYRDFFGGAYVLDPDVLKDERMIAFSFSGDLDEVRASWVSFLDSLGYEVAVSNGVDYVRPKQRIGRVAGSVFVYRPNYRDASQIGELMSALVPENFVPSVGVSPAKDGLGSGSSLKIGSEILVFRGSPSDIERIKSLLQQIDVPQSDVIAHALVYEVSHRSSESSAISLLLSVLKGRLDFRVGESNSGGSFVSFKNSTVDAVLSALSVDSRFKVVTNPRLRIQSGRTAHFSVGREVPTLSGVSYVGAVGNTVQSIAYKSAGVIFNLSPVVRERQIEVNVSHQISDFSRTDTGVNNSPTLIKRELATSVVVEDGELIVIGGLQQRNQQSQRQGLSFLPHFLDSRSAEADETELLLLLQVSRATGSARQVP